jgi:hypothetical protein
MTTAGPMTTKARARRRPPRSTADLPFPSPRRRPSGTFGQREFRALVSYHSFLKSSCIHGDTRSPDRPGALHRSLAGQMSALMAAVNGRFMDLGSAASLYLTNGDTTDWAFGVAAFRPHDRAAARGRARRRFFNAELTSTPSSGKRACRLFLIDWAIGESRLSRFGRESEGLLRATEGPDPEPALEKR